MAFTYEVSVRFHEVDRAGIAFYGRVFEYAHVAFEELLLAIDSSWTSVFDDLGWGMPLVHADADFERPMRLSERLSVSVEVESMGARSLTFAFKVIGSQDGVTRATVRQVHAFVDMERFESMPVPDEMRQGLSRLGLLDHLEDASS
jgi:1,4-dihydroxy-2-naphthoyl-CoA hydrolase